MSINSTVMSVVFSKSSLTRFASINFLCNSSICSLLSEGGKRYFNVLFVLYLLGVSSILIGDKSSDPAKLQLSSLIRICTCTLSLETFLN